MNPVQSNDCMVRPKTYRLIVSDANDGTLKVNRVEYLKKTNQHKQEWKNARQIGVTFVNSTDGRVLVKRNKISTGRKTSA
jgi:hypothetical protein